jgi:hypothetical protein
MLKAKIYNHGIHGTHGKNAKPKENHVLCISPIDGYQTSFGSRFSSVCSVHSVVEKVSSSCLLWLLQIEQRDPAQTLFLVRDAVA